MSGNSLFDCCRLVKTNSCDLFEKKYIVPRQIKPRSLESSVRRGQSNFAVAFISFLTAKKRFLLKKVLTLSRTVGAAIICKDKVKLEKQAIKDCFLIRQFNV